MTDSRSWVIISGMSVLMGTSAGERCLARGFIWIERVLSGVAELSTEEMFSQGLHLDRASSIRSG